MGVLKYDEPMTCMFFARLTESQASSLTAISHSMSLTVGDVVRFAIDELIEDLPERRLFTTTARHATPDSPVSDARPRSRLR